MTRISQLALASSLLLAYASGYIIYITLGLSQSNGCLTEWLNPYRSLSNISSDGTALPAGLWQGSIRADGDVVGESLQMNR